MGIRTLAVDECRPTSPYGAILRIKVDSERSHCKVQGHSAVICTKTAEPIDVQFG